MPKKLSTTITAIVGILALNVFAIGSAIALSYDQPEETQNEQDEQDGEEGVEEENEEEAEEEAEVEENTEEEVVQSPLTSPLTLCKEAVENLSAEIKALRARAISMQISKRELSSMIKALKQNKNQLCREAKKYLLEERDRQGLTSPLILCKEAKKNLGAHLREIVENAMSLQLSKEEIKRLKEAVRQYKKQVCKESSELEKFLKRNT